MKRGQGAIWIVVGFIVVIALFGVIVWSFRPTTTGQVIIGGEVVEENFLDEPFELRAWVVNPEGVQLDIGNGDKRPYILKRVEIDGCGVFEYGGVIDGLDSRIFTVPCSLEKGSSFRGTLVVVYSEDFGGEELLSRGGVSDIV